MRATGIGSLPGTDFRGAVAAMAECFPESVPLPELPDRGLPAGILGRATALLDELPVDLGPGGWRLADGDDAAARAARSWWRRDLDDLEETLAGEAATVKIAVCGPLTLAAGLHLRHGEVLLGDPGALREVGQSLAAGIGALQVELRRRMPRVCWLWQLDEPAAPAVLAGRIPTQSGLHRHRPMNLPGAVGLCREVVAAVRDAGAEEIGWHCCAGEVPWDLLDRTDVDEVLVDLSLLGTEGIGHCAQWLESGKRVGLGVVPTGIPDRVLDADRIIDGLKEFTHRVGVGPDLIRTNGLLTPACGLASWSQPAAWQQCRQLSRAGGMAEEALQD
ncbi:methionine synthase [Acidipropionibacterium jensenii]|uniref:methionine synthase n=1 Tax=Acidipropionibacterium jensenii TaxID=1749 RepID=UPI00214AE308|nr:methionine synthase [Acidipropionibacterium jensenii]